MTLPFRTVKPMLARLEEQLPVRGGWLYEPKWDGFRGLLFKEGRTVRLLSRNGKELRDYFPSIPPAAAELPDCVLDGEIVAVRNGRQDFEALQEALAGRPSPASFIAFDILALDEEDLRSVGFGDRRTTLESLPESDSLNVTPQTDSSELATRWLRELAPSGFEGVVAKKAASPYRPGERQMVKVKHWETADLVVGGYTGPVGDPRALLLGAFDQEGLLHHVGGTTLLSAQQKSIFVDAMTAANTGSFTGAQPGPGRWKSQKLDQWVPVVPNLVVEVSYNRIDSGRIRHAARLLRPRPDKDPAECLVSTLVTW